jgi:hypothetical protein
MRWRDKLFKTKNKNLQKQLDKSNLENLKLQKSLTQMEAILQEERDQNQQILIQQEEQRRRHQQQQQQFRAAASVAPAPPLPLASHNNNRNRNSLTSKHRYMQIENLDSEIAKLKHDIETRKSRRHYSPSKTFFLIVQKNMTPKYFFNLPFSQQTKKKS